jgi:hypothetical protein
VSRRALGAAASAFLALACSGGEAGRAPDRAAPAATVPAPPAPRDERPSARRGDRHARADATRARIVKRAEGVVARASDRRVVIRPHGAAEVTLQIGRGTTVLVDGAPSRGGALRTGASVRAAYDARAGSRPVAIRLESGAGGR